jgi:hypothetical protein
LTFFALTIVERQIVLSAAEAVADVERQAMFARTA